MSDSLGAAEDMAGLERMLDELRGEVPVRAEWRAETGRVLAAEAASVAAMRALPSRSGTSRGWQVRPLTAVAAALGFTILGALGGSSLRETLATEARAVPPLQQAAHTVTDGGDIGVRFAVMAPNVKRVSLVGDFNGWDPKATPLSLARDGRTWTILLPLSSGRHTYAFVIDDEIVADPAAPPAIEDDFGKPSSFVLVASSDR